MRKRTTNTGMWLPQQLQSFILSPGKCLKIADLGLFLCHWEFCESPQEIFRPRGSSGFTLVWISVTSSFTGEAQLCPGSCGFSWGREVGTVQVLLCFCGCCLHSGRHWMNTKDYFPLPEPITKPLSQPEPIAKDPGTFFAYLFGVSWIIPALSWSGFEAVRCSSAALSPVPVSFQDLLEAWLSQQDAGWDSPLPKPSQL